MADIITPILNIVSAVLCSFSGNNRCCYLLDLQENKEDLNNALVELRATRDSVKIRVDEAENNPSQKRTPQVDIWLQSVRTVDAEVVIVIQKADQEIQGRCFRGNCPKNCRNARKIGKLVIRNLAIVKELKSKGDLFVDVAYKLPPPCVQVEPTNTTVGMESMFDKVWSSLAEDEVKIMGLYGYGGVGKTTLLKQINNEFLKSTTTTTHGFDVVIVVVSKVINIDAIQKEIGNRLGLSSPDRRSIFNALTKRNFLLLLDDIWERVDLQSIGVPCPINTSKSKVVFTTRSETVCGLMEANKMLKVQCLPWSKAWSLFQEKVGEVALNSFSRAHELAKDVARECGGLPLALVTIGRAMSTKKSLQEWKHAITTLRKSASELPGMGDEVLPLLKLSYDNLRDDTIKSCFLYCALFPEDKSINKAKLIDHWIGEGLILLNEFDHIDEARNYGYNVIGDLKGACLLESGKYEETQVKMHDTIRDLALWIANIECGGIKKDKKMLTIEGLDVRSERSWYNAERIYLNPPEYGVAEVPPPPPPPLKSPNLLTLIYSCGQSRLPQNFFQLMPLLRVLDLSNSRLETFPTSITELPELRYLSLSSTYIKQVPEELGRLVKLNYLDLSYMMGLKKIPSGVIGSLLELRVLNLQECSGHWDFDEVHKLKHLNDLAINIYTQHNLNKLLSNKNLQMCTRKLNLFNPNSLISFEQSEDKTSSSSPIRTLEKLELLSNLETLSLHFFHEAELMNMGICENHYNYYYYIEQQHHLGSSCFQNLSQVYLWCCNALKDLTWVGYLGNLKTLGVRGCEELEEIVVIVVVDDSGGSTGGGGGRGGDEIISSSSSSSSKNKMMMNNVQDIFKSLETLDLISLPKLKSICRNALAFPCLESLVVLECPQLKKLPFDSGSNVNNTLLKIEGGPKWWSELQWDNNNNNNELLKSKFLPYEFNM